MSINMYSCSFKVEYLFFLCDPFPPFPVLLSRLLSRSAMSYPASGLEATYRNKLEDVALMLHSRHSDHFMVGVPCLRLISLWGSLGDTHTDIHAYLLIYTH